MEDLADLAESEMSSIDGGNDLCSVGSFGSAGSTNRRKLQSMRSKHAKCLQALKGKTGGGVPSDLSLKMDPADRMRRAVNKQMLHARAVAALGSAGDVASSRQVTAESCGSFSAALVDFERAATLPADGTFANAANDFEDADVRMLLGRQVKSWEDVSNDLSGIREALGMQQGGLEALSPQDAKPLIVELRNVVGTQGRELEQLHLQDTNVVVRSLKDGVEAFDKLGSQRMEETQGAVERLKAAIIAQSKDFEGLKLMGSDFKNVQQSISNQAQRLSKLQPAVRELREELFRARAAVSARGGALESLTRQLQDQRQDHLNEVQRLRVALRVQDERSAGLRAEIAAIRQREVAVALQVEDSSFGAGSDPEAGRSHSVDFHDKSCEKIRQRQTTSGVPPEMLQLAVAGFLGAVLPLLVSLGFPRHEHIAFSTGVSRSVPPSWHALARNAVQPPAVLPALAPVSYAMSHTPAIFTTRKLRLGRRKP
mmetsp:Transcript_57856/g.114755  ORF Transcript_57856/g.114755 Transcript_57856/m.114755 type:complete len:483 (-) Transcript_57856:91-1539(-)